MASTYTRQLLQIVSDYRKAGGAWPAKKIEIAAWALAHGRWDIPREGKLRVCADELANAMREATVLDEGGRSVRVLHPATTSRDGEQGTFWDDLRTADMPFVRTVVTQKRNAIAADCHQLKNIVRYVNEHRDEQLVLILDFTADVEELELARNAQPRAPSSPTRSSSTSRTPLSVRPRRAHRPSVAAL